MKMLSLQPGRAAFFAMMASLLAACAPPEPAVAPVVTPATPAATQPTKPAPADGALSLPAQLAGKAVVVAKGDPDEARANVAGAIKAAGEGGITRGLVVRLTADVPVWRMWSGPTKKDANGRTNRMGQWWSYDAPHGTAQGYRTDYEICASWNELTWVAQCTLKKGAVIAVGPGNSVSPATCSDQSGKETYPANTRDWQVWVDKVWARPTELECPADTSDYEANPADIAHPKKKAGATPQ